MSILIFSISRSFILSVSSSESFSNLHLGYLDFSYLLLIIRFSIWSSSLSGSCSTYPCEFYTVQSSQTSFSYIRTFSMVGPDCSDSSELYEFLGQVSRPPFSKFWGAILGHRKRENKKTNIYIYIYMLFEAPQVRITFWWNLGWGVRPKLYKSTLVWAPLKSSKSTPDPEGGNPDLERVIFDPPARFKASKNWFFHCGCGGAGTTEVLVDRRIWSQDAETSVA